MLPSDAIRSRRSVRRFSPRPLSNDELAALLDAATLGPNHRLTQPWRFHVLGPESRYAYGLALGARKAKKLTDADAARTLQETVAAEHRDLPAMIAVAVATNDNPEIAEEDYAAVMMGVQNLMIVAVERGLGTQLRTGAVMADPAARAAAGVVDGARIIVVVNIGEPAEAAAPKAREPAERFTTWMP